MAFIVKGPAVCNKPGCGKCWDVVMWTINP